MSTPHPIRFTLVTGNFLPDFSATGQLLTELAVGLRKLGCEVWVYTSQPAYGAQGRSPSFEVHEGVEIRRVFSTQLDKNQRIGRTLNAVTFFVSVFWVLLWRRNRGPLLIVS